MAEQWRGIYDTPLPGKMNMEKDLEIMQAVSAGAAPPTLRLYRWSPPALSLGYFQKEEAVVDREACRRLGIDVVRRPTGGRAVLHYRELTYSIVVPEAHPLMPRGVLDSYKFLSGGIMEAFRLLGITPSLASGKRREQKPGPGSCFDAPSAYEVQVGGKKVVGSAQLRRHGVLLQHGSILLELHLELYKKILRLSGPEDKVTAYLERLTKKAAGLHDLGHPVSADDLAAALFKGFSKIFATDISVPP
ncbi:MAG: lipoate--protein ligase family protein [Bacillota bacterium]